MIVTLQSGIVWEKTFMKQFLLARFLRIFFWIPKSNAENFKVAFSSPKNKVL